MKRTDSAIDDIMREAEEEWMKSNPKSLALSSPMDNGTFILFNESLNN